MRKRFKASQHLTNLPDPVHIRSVKESVLQNLLHGCILQTHLGVDFAAKILNQLTSVRNCLLGSIGTAPTHLNQCSLRWSKILPQGQFHSAWLPVGTFPGWADSKADSWRCLILQTPRRLSPFKTPFLLIGWLYQDSHPAWVSPKVGNVFWHPVQGQSLVSEPCIAWNLGHFLRVCKWSLELGPFHPQDCRNLMGQACSWWQLTPRLLEKKKGIKRKI